MIGALVALLFAGTAQLAIGGWGHWRALLDGHGWFYQFGQHAWRSLGDGYWSPCRRIASDVKLAVRAERPTALSGMIPDEITMQTLKVN